MPTLTAASRYINHLPMPEGAAGARRLGRLDRLKTGLGRLWTTEPLLAGSALVLFTLLIPTALGLWLDPRLITGAPAWLKPAKFALSTAVYAATLAWVFQFLPDFPRTRRSVGRLTVVVFFLEIGIIDLQAWRGTTSHFNIATPLDTALFSAMGLGIAVQTLASIAVAVAFCRQRFADPALGWALRLGMILSILGASTGGLMTRPTPAQLAAAKVTQTLPIVGAHTVGAPDGGPGLPGTGWSTAHGDLRVPHFFGLHAIQALPLFTLLFRRQSDRRRVQLTWIAASAYAGMFALLLAQALRGLPFLAIG